VVEEEVVVVALDDVHRDKMLLVPQDDENDVVVEVDLSQSLTVTNLPRREESVRPWIFSYHIVPWCRVLGVPARICYYSLPPWR
jgi:hypothetical protein